VATPSTSVQSHRPAQKSPGQINRAPNFGVNMGKSPNKMDITYIYKYDIPDIPDIPDI
jgi:hypothetical protein